MENFSPLKQMLALINKTKYKPNLIRYELWVEPEHPGTSTFLTSNHVSHKNCTEGYVKVWECFASDWDKACKIYDKYLKGENDG